MKRFQNKVTAATFVAAVAVLLGLGSCKGRTMENMEPTGETIEVTIDQEEGAEEQSDSINVTPEASDDAQP